MDFYFFVGSSCFRSEACMAEYAASEGGGGAPGITAPVALCIVLSRVISLTTADSRSALASSELSFLLLRFCGTPQSLSIFWIRCLWARVGCICSSAIAECTRFKGGFARCGLLEELEATRCIPEGSHLTALWVVTLQH